MLKSKVVRLYRYYSKFILTLVVCSLCFITILLSILGSYSDRSLNLCNVPSEDELLNYEYKPEANYSFHETLRRNANIKNGGHWEPTLCTARYHTIIIIPFRDRAEQLPIILAHLHSFLQLQLLDYKIVVVEQTDSDVPFNKAMLMNIAFKVINQKYPQYDCFIFHDVDMIPEDARNLYRCGRFPRHLSPAVDEFNYTMPYPTIVGGVFAINQKQFRLVNGFSNMYWGWGAEDDDMYYRVKFSNLFLSRPLEDIGRYTMLKHPKRKRWGPRTMGVYSFLYYPSLAYNLLRHRVGPTDWPWYSRIDDTVILGALPFKSMMDDLINKEKVAGVVCLTEPFEIEKSWAASRKDWEARGVKYFWLPMADFSFDAKLPDVQKAVKFIREFENTGNSVYVHCKAGRSRSATVVACYLMERHQWYSTAAFAMIKPKRPHIKLVASNWKIIEEYGKLYVWGKGLYTYKDKTS